MRKLLSPILILIFWEAVVQLNIVDPLLLPAPSFIFSNFFQLIVSKLLILHIISSLKRMSIGFSLAILTSLPIGILMGWYRIAEDVIDPIVELTRPISVIAIYPLAILWFGIGDASKIFLIWLACSFPIILNTYAGVKGIDQFTVYAAKSLGAKDREVLTRVALPYSLPFIMAGIRISLGIALIVIIASEMIAARSGLGYMILTAQQTYKVEEVFVGIITIGLLGLGFDRLLRSLQHRIMPWHMEEVGSRKA